LRLTQEDPWQNRFVGRRHYSMGATVATLLLDASVDIKKVQDLLGHRHITTTHVYDKRRITASQSASHDVPFEITPCLVPPAADLPRSSSCKSDKLIGTTPLPFPRPRSSHAPMKRDGGASWCPGIAEEENVTLMNFSRSLSYHHDETVH